jgi:hypothetical protein
MGIRGITVFLVCTCIIIWRNSAFLGAGGNGYILRFKGYLRWEC